MPELGVEVDEESERFSYFVIVAPATGVHLYEDATTHRVYFAEKSELRLKRADRLRDENRAPAPIRFRVVKGLEDDDGIGFAAWRTAKRANETAPLPMIKQQAVSPFEDELALHHPHGGALPQRSPRVVVLASAVV